MSDVFAELDPPYSTIVADPPWHYDARVMGWGGGTAPMPYSTMSVDEIAAMPVREIAAPGSHLYLWTTNHHIWSAHDICVAWGFRPSQVLVWCKPPAGRRPGGLFANTTEFIVYARSMRGSQTWDGEVIRAARMGEGKTRSDLVPTFIGHYKNAESVKAQLSNWERGKNVPTEHDWELLRKALPTLADAERPRIEPAQPNRVDRSWWEWPISGHSVKPAGFLDIVEQVSPGPYVELFARQPRLGWDSWGYGYERNVGGAA